MKHLLRLRIFLKPYRLAVILALISIICLTAASLLMPAILRAVIDVGLVQGEMRFLVFSALVILGIGLLSAGLSYTQRYLGEWVAAHIGYDLRNRLYNHIQQLPFSFHDHSQTGQLISRCIEDVRAIERFTGFSLIELIHLVLLMIGVITLLLFLQPQLAIIALMPMIPLIWMTTSFGRRVGKYFLDVDNALGEVSSRVQENVSGVQVIRAFAREPYEIERFSQANRVLFNARVFVINQFSKIMPTSHLMVTLSTILILWFGGQLVLTGQFTVGDVVAFNSYLLLLAAPAQQLAWLVNSAGEAVAGVQRTFEVLDLEPEIQSPSEGIFLPTLSGQVEFDHVNFHYLEQTMPALIDINLSVEPNQVIALIGPTGSGKTSLVSLIPRFYDASEGTVRIDGIDVRQVDLPSLRRQIGIVLQTSLLFSASITENIAYGRPDACMDEITAAAKAAQAHDFIIGLPEGYQTVIGERGVTLSGGERQRVAIARALLMDPRILILDDSTSSVDTETEHLIQQALTQMMQDRTVFVIAHRLSTVRRADLILVLSNGRIIERGKHEELLQKNGLYNEIYDLQLKDQEHLRENVTAYTTIG